MKTSDNKGLKDKKKFEKSLKKEEKKEDISNKLDQYIANSTFEKGEIAGIIGISVSGLSRIVNGKASTTLEKALKLSYILDCSVNDLFFIDSLKDELKELQGSKINGKKDGRGRKKGQDKGKRRGFF